MRYVLVRVLAAGAFVLARDWTWVDLDRRADWRIFPSRIRADRARRTYGRGQWRSMMIEPVYG